MAVQTKPGKQLQSFFKQATERWLVTTELPQSLPNNRLCKSYRTTLAKLTCIAQSFLRSPINCNNRLPSTSALYLYLSIPRVEHKPLSHGIADTELHMHFPEARFNRGTPNKPVKGMLLRQRHVIAQLSYAEADIT